MRINNALCVVVVISGLLFAIFITARPTPAVSLHFLAFSKGIDGSPVANFQLHIGGAGQIIFSGERARIQIKTATGWTNYVDAMETIRGGGGMFPIDGRSAPWIDRHAPHGPETWRLHGSYSVWGPPWTRIIGLQHIAAALHVGERDIDVYSQEMITDTTR
jgi:hypothetical protein